MSRVSPQLIVFSYHKSGTSLLLHVMTKICERLGLSLVNQYGLVDRIEVQPDVVLLPHSMMSGPPGRPYRAIRMIRDPRDIWVSGYLYHRHCNEEWCTNVDMDPTPPIRWPRVDYSFAHRPEEWKRGYLERLNGKSYQRNLLDRSLAEGLDFELEGYTGCTLAAMRQWGMVGAEALDVKLESMMADFDGEMRQIFDHFGFTEAQSKAALEVARSEDIHRMDDASLAERPQIHSRRISKWRDILPAAHLARFEALNGDLIHTLGYETAGEAVGGIGANGWFPRDFAPFVVGAEEVRLIWPEPAADADDARVIMRRTHHPEIWLSAGGVRIRPMVSDGNAYSFVVPAHVGSVWLQSDSGSVGPGDAGPASVRVREIVIRSRSRESVIPADDPRLVTGWHGAEQAGGECWRWTDGSAELPWGCVDGPAVVTVRC
jgi:hypothetical protein